MPRVEAEQGNPGSEPSPTPRHPGTPAPRGIQVG
uniref:Uncharacterized protein n=1 Tax=Siphoviridae sp. ctpyK9 TaxID=2825679 RepID=A0A8S5UUA0_9CAUD|nr:MAG TPA: hypothetical protein [Siphoviridae sp. ctpyK9]